MASQVLPLQIYALGPPEVRLGKNLVMFPTRKTLALLLYLAIETGAQPREHLGALLWPEASAERSHGSLRNTLNHLKSALRQAGGQSQVSYLTITHNSLGLNPNSEITVDIKLVEQAYTQARIERASRSLPEGTASLPLLQSAVACLRGEFLAGFSLSDAPDFDDWAAVQREILHRRLSLILDRLSEIQFAHGEYASAIETASRWIALDALNEIAYRRKMRAQFATGERGPALETYDACRAALLSELGIEPEQDTAVLAEHIRTQPIHKHVYRRHISPDAELPDTSYNFLGGLFTGRNREYEILLDTYERAAQGHPQLVVLRGDTGIGKTRLARKFINWSHDRGAELLLGSPFESGSHLPFLPIIEALRLWLENDISLTPLVDEIWLPTLSPLLPELRQQNPDLPSTAEDPSQLDGDINQRKFYEPLVQCMLALAKRAPLVLFIDDLQWVDSATLDLLSYASRRWQDNAARILFLASLRSDALLPTIQPLPGNTQSLDQWLDRMTRELTPIHIELEPLGEDETMQMMRSILVPPDVDFAKWLYDETHGQPYYLIETLKDLLERGVLHPKRRGEGKWTFSVDSDHDLDQVVRVPSTVHAVVRSRLNRLSPKAFSLLAGGAVLENQITFERMCAISNLSEDQAIPALDELISGRLLLENFQPGVVSAYTFTNDMLRDVVYTEAGDARRRTFHRRALEILGEQGESAAVLAHHAVAAGLVQDAYRYSVAAGREALRLQAVNEAIVHFENALQFVREATLTEMPAQGDLLDLYSQLSRAYQLSGQKEMIRSLEAERERLVHS